MDEDWRLLSRFEQGDRAAFETLFSKYKSLVVTLAFRVVKHRDLAEDVAQDVFLKIYQGKLPFWRAAKFTTWLYKVTVNQALDALRRRKRAPTSLDEPLTQEEDASLIGEVTADASTPSPSEALQRQELLAVVRRAVSQLPEQLRLPLVLYQFQEMSYADIGHILGISPKAVERRLYQARELLRAKLDQNK